MTASILTHPVFTFAAGAVLALLVLFLLLTSCARPNESFQQVAAYRAAMDAAGPAAEGDQAGIERFEAFLKNVGDKSYVHENTAKTYSANAYLDDTLAIHHGAAEIEAYFTKTAETMKSYEVTIDDVARSGRDWYVRWTLTFSASALSGGKPIKSVGVSQVRIGGDGKVALHKDFWDSGQNFYGHLPLVGGAVGFVRKRLESE